MSKRVKGNNVNGWMIIDKPRGMGSTDVVTHTRRWCNANKNGHAGTLDPFATGVLPIAFGEATKLLPLVTDGQKEYEFLLQLGYESSTDDSDGDIKKSPEMPLVTNEDMLNVLPEFVGKITQIPPIYSAIKIDGKRAYDLARQGVEVEMKPREIEIYDLELKEAMPDNQFRIKVKCSKGTYVRTLGKDIAIKLGTVGYLKELRRTESGVFGLGDAIKLEVIEKLVYREDETNEVLLPVQACLRDIAVIALGEADAAKLKQGQAVSPKNYNVESGEAVAVCDDKLVAIVRIDERRIAPVRVFNM
ncbi:MAG: tRNA pseudouridine(55) synthase TruB [Lactobacillus sp.]|jgi:tRNA pseudouridine55 synthase|nr:tRNA pseudouridine(55) synthase TruB [Lactobacillus sp.]